MAGYIQKKLITKTEAAKRLGVCRQTLYTMIDDKRLTPVRITSTQTRIRTEEVEKLLGIQSFEKGVAM